MIPENNFVFYKFNANRKQNSSHKISAMITTAIPERVMPIIGPSLSMSACHVVSNI
ncbi:MAG: hypothetical protein WKF87_08195 [Chryseolinea sp.]